MANLVLIKNNYNAGSGSTGAPASSDIQIGELAVDVYDNSGSGAILYTKASDGTIVNVTTSTQAGSISAGTACNMPYYSGAGQVLSKTDDGSGNGMFWDSGTDRLGINTNSPTSTLQITGTDGVVIPVGTTAQRSTATQGKIRYNTTLSSFEGYSGSAWGSLGGLVDVDQDTYICAEVATDDDELAFYNAGTISGKFCSGGDLSLSCNLCVTGNLTVLGTTTTVQATTITIDDKNIELGAVATPTDTTADGGGITLKGATDKTILWTNSTDSWDFNQAIKTDHVCSFNIGHNNTLTSSKCSFVAGYNVENTHKCSIAIGVGGNNLNYVHACQGIGIGYRTRVYDRQVLVVGDTTGWSTNEVLTGGTTGATGKVISVDSATQVTVRVISETYFAGTEDVSDGTNSSAITSISETQKARESIAIGACAEVYGCYGTAVGRDSFVSGNNSSAFGINSCATGNYAAAIGNGATVEGSFGVAIGYNACTDSNNFQIAIGSSA